METSCIDQLRYQLVEEYISQSEMLRPDSPILSPSADCIPNWILEVSHILGIVIGRLKRGRSRDGEMAVDVEICSVVRCSMTDSILPSAS